METVVVHLNVLQERLTIAIRPSISAPSPLVLAPRSSTRFQVAVRIILQQDCFVSNLKN